MTVVRREIKRYIKLLRSSRNEEILSESSSILLVEVGRREEPLSFVTLA